MVGLRQYPLPNSLSLSLVRSLEPSMASLVCGGRSRDIYEREKEDRRNPLNMFLYCGHISLMGDSIS